MGSRDRESRVRVDLTAVVIAVREGTPCVLTVEASAQPAIALPSGPLEPGHQSLQSGLRSWVERQTQHPLGYVEQLYTFGDRATAQLEPDVASQQKAISITYLALVASTDPPRQGRWRNWYDFFPWEDMRAGVPAARDPLLKRLKSWAGKPGRPTNKRRLERARLTFGIGDAPWDEERVLERYELLYEAGLVPEAFVDRGTQPPSRINNAVSGLPMVSDHRRILATAISRLRAKIKYRPVLFELMPPAFTLSELQKTAEALSGIPLHKQNFRRLIAQQGLVEETGEVAMDTGGRPAKLVRFRREVTLERPAPGVRVSATRRGSYP
ncbi:MAG: hypothetical protein GEU89_19720 [Kiloniellaceae bacterium]|nr:hypothetical protein [Kiloniellaceae bacterium]